MSDSKFSINNNSAGVVRKKIYVKYMVCSRDKMILRSELDKMGFNYEISAHGAIEFHDDITNGQYHEFKMGLKKSGLILLDDRESMLIDRIITTIVEVIHYEDVLPKLSFADFISEFSYTGTESILKIFSDVKGISVLQFIVLQKIERAKELLLYEDLSQSEIAEILNYKNMDFFLAQFKKFTGLTPAYFLRIKKERMEIVKQRSKSRSGISELKSRSIS